MDSFAGPFVGNERFANLYDSLINTSRRIVNMNDEVPKLPPSPVIIIEPNPEIFFYEPIMTEMLITFGNPISEPFDISDLEFNRSLCNYYNTLCNETTDPDTCQAMANGADDCNPPSQ